jgi:hypothetical protein
MIKHFNKLREMNLIDKYQCEYLIKSVQKESTMENYYKSSKNVGKVLSSYEFQQQFIKLKKKYKFIKKVRRKQSQLNKYNYNADDEARKRGYSSNSRFSQFRPKSRKISNYINDEESKLGYNKIYDVNNLIEGGAIERRKASTYMRRTLFKRIKDEGVYSESEEESEDESFDNDSIDIVSRKKEMIELDHSSNSKKSEDNKNNSNKINIKEKGQINTIKEDENSEDISSSVDTQYRDYVRNLKKNARLQNNLNNENTQINSMKEGLKDGTIANK